MKTAEEIITENPSPVVTGQPCAFISLLKLKKIQLDAMKEGMQRAANINNALAEQFVGNIQANGTRSSEIYFYGIGCERAYQAIITTAEQLTEKDL